MRKLKRVHKSLYIFEAGFIYCYRRGIEYTDDKFIDEIFLSEDFISEGEFEHICEDLRCYRYHEAYQLQEISEAEYEMCIDEFGEL